MLVHQRGLLVLRGLHHDGEEHGGVAVDVFDLDAVQLAQLLLAIGGKGGGVHRQLVLTQIGLDAGVGLVEVEEELVLFAPLHSHVRRPVPLLCFKGEEGLLVVDYKLHIIALGVGEEVEAGNQRVGGAGENKPTLLVSYGSVYNLVAAGIIAPHVHQGVAAVVDFEGNLVSGLLARLRWHGQKQGNSQKSYRFEYTSVFHHSFINAYILFILCCGLFFSSPVFLPT